jgi:hypothetical protein
MDLIRERRNILDSISFQNNAEILGKIVASFGGSHIKKY